MYERLYCFRTDHAHRTEGQYQPYFPMAMLCDADDVAVALMSVAIQHELWNPDPSWPVVDAFPTWVRVTSTISITSGNNEE